MICTVGTSSAYCEMEQLVFNSLTTLIKDTGVLRDYAGLSLLLVQVSLGGKLTAALRCPTGIRWPDGKLTSPEATPETPWPPCDSLPRGGGVGCVPS